MQEQLKPPVDDAYWIIPGKFLAGEFPLLPSEKRLGKKLRTLLENHITFFVNLTEESEKNLLSYESILHEEADLMNLKAEHCQMPIRDFDITTPEHMKHILHTIDSALAAGHKIYLHCFAGMGRTAMVAGCYLVQQGLSGEEALKELKRLTQGTSFERHTIPVTAEQRQMVLDWLTLNTLTP